MRVAYVVSRFPSTTETFIAREMTELQRRGVELELFALRQQSDAVLQPEAAPLVGRLRTPSLLPMLAAQVTWIMRRPATYLAVWCTALSGNARSPRFLARALIAVPAGALLARQAQRAGVQHLHAHWATHSALTAWVAGRLTGLPYSVTVHAHDLFVDRSMLTRKLGDAHFVATVSDFNRRFIERTCGSEIASKTVVVRCGVDTDRFTPTEEPRPSGPLRVLCIGSLQEYKGHAVLLQALAILRRASVAVQCRLVGDGPLRGRLEQQAAALGLDDEVLHLGGRSSDEVRILLRWADVVVQPSIVTARGKMEGIPVALMEAMATGRPVVASALSGVPELVEDGVTGLLVAPGDPLALAHALTRLAEDAPLRAALGRAGRRRVAEGFDSRRSAETLLALLTSGAPPVVDRPEPGLAPGGAR